MRASVTIVAAAVLSTGLAGQEAQQPPPPFKSGVQVVEVDVRVFDKDGRFVTDLARHDFELLEDGAPQRIEALYRVGAPVRSDTLNPEARTPSPELRTPSPVAPQTWVFFFDLNHLTPGAGFDRARKAVEDFVRDRFKDGDLAGILAGDRMVNNRLTSVRGELLEAVTQVKPRGDSRTRFVELTREWPRFLDEEEALRAARNETEVIRRVVARACSEDPDACRRAPPDMEVMEKGRRLQRDIHAATLQTLNAVNVLGSGLARIPGPKTVVFLSDGFATQDMETALRTVVGQTTRAGARVYAIDVRGLGRVANPGLLDQPVVEDPAGAGARFDSLADGTNSLAVDTGGLMIRNENNISRALDRISEDAGRYYVLAYQPANSNFDGKFRSIQVRVKRDGVRVRARKGYLALSPARMLKAEPITSGDAGAPGPAAPARPKPDEPEKPAPATDPPAPPLPATGSIVTPPPAATAAAATASTAAVRLRPDGESRIKALSARDAKTAIAGFAKEGWDAYQRGDLETAEPALEKAAAEPDARPWILYALGMSQAGLGQVDAAIATWEKVRRAVPDFAPVYMDLADTYAAKSDLTTALAIVREAQKRWPDSGDVLSAIGVIHVRRGALDEGIESLVEVTRLKPDDALAFLNLGRAYALRFHRGRRYVTSQRRWVAPEGDRTKAMEAFRACVKLGGPYATPAAQELSLLEWK
jgi:VWFA-related protein